MLANDSADARIVPIRGTRENVSCNAAAFALAFPAPR